ncbi:hypothetical protein [Leifsonia shinshuensis]|uniref:hypothetical protein n=1 Tax=Leifsonia shinshuensis TaxID=150026 RepID=UPI00285FFB0B|nr:hypothetical protein [Leifsonia shinshuensis]MDR6972012.1 cytochrome c oxidase subunit 1 [Leifsonia shinshuensis]
MTQGNRPDASGRRSRSSAVAAVLFALGIACAIVSAILFAVPRTVTSFGWYAYAPLSSSYFAPSGVDAALQWALGLAAASLILVAGTVGWWLGRRSRTNAQPRPAHGS